MPLISLTPQQEFHQKIIHWYEKHGRKHLPWQFNKTYYSVWLSEIMLQQTQVATVIPYYENFLRKFPSVQDLAKAHSDEVMSLWSGLGYYARARNLHKTAQIITEKFNGLFPETIEKITELPGIGRSTAGAILSLTQNLPYPILDGNVKRVLSRYFCENQEKALWTHAESLIQPKNAANYTQAMMDLGASICTRTQPKCSLCPLAQTCQAKLSDQIDSFPAKSKVKQKETQLKFILIFINDNKILLERREETGIWGGLFACPLIDNTEENLLKIKKLESEKNIISVKIQPEKTHAFSHFQLRYVPVVIHLKSSEISAGKNLENLINPTKTELKTQWREYQQALTLGLPKPIREILERIKS